MSEKTLVFDIETTGLNYFEDRITCICCEDLDEDFQQVFSDENEKNIIVSFVEFVKENNYKKLITANGKNFDIPFIFMRGYFSDINYEYVKILLDLEHFDVVNDITSKRISLNDLARLFHLAEKIGDGKNAIELYKQGKMEELTEYCLWDVHLTKLVYKKYIGED